MSSSFKIISITFLFFATSFTLVQKKRVIFFGDSITQAGVQPGGYIVKINEIAAKQNKADQFDFIGTGIGGNKIYDLFLRMQDDVLSKNPDVVVIYVGVNDVWHKSSYGTGTDPEKFEKFYTAIINTLKAKNISVILCTPAVIGERTDSSNPQDGDLNYYSNIIRKLAQKNELPLVDLRKSFLEYNLKYNPDNKESGILTSDRVHLNEKGNQLVAEEMWKVINASK